MKPSLESSLRADLNREIEGTIPDVWAGIQKRIATGIARSLIRDLEGLPSPQGRILDEIKTELQDRVVRKLMGA